MIYGSSDFSAIIDRLGSCHSASEFLNLYIRIKTLGDQKFSIRKFSTHLGYNTPSFVSDVLRGKRKFNFNLFQRLTKAEKFSEMECQFLLNILMSESAPSEDQASYRKSNQAILEFWRNKFVYHRNASPIDKIILEFIQGRGSVEWAEVIEVFKSYFPESVVYERLRFLTIDSRNVKRQGDLLSVDSDQASGRFILPRNADQDLLPVLKNTLVDELSDQNFVTLFNSYLTEEEFEEAKKIIRSCVEKMVLLSMKSDEESRGEQRQLRTLFLNYVSVLAAKPTLTNSITQEQSQPPRL